MAIVDTPSAVQIEIANIFVGNKSVLYIAATTSFGIVYVSRNKLCCSRYDNEVRSLLA